MKLTRKKLNTLIENFLFEQAQTDEKGFFDRLLRNKKMIVSIGKIAKMFMGAKSDAGIKGSDKYFHFLCFHAIGTYIRENAGDNIDDLTFNFTAITAGIVKETLYDGLLHIITGGSPEIEDMEVNLLGLNQGIAGKSPVETAKRMAPAYTDVSKQFIASKYSYAIDMRPDIYDMETNETTYMLPRYCIWLKPEERQFAAKKDDRGSMMTGDTVVDSIIINYIGHDSSAPTQMPTGGGGRNSYPPHPAKAIIKM